MSASATIYTKEILWQTLERVRDDQTLHVDGDTLLHRQIRDGALDGLIRRVAAIYSIEDLRAFARRQRLGFVHKTNGVWALRREGHSIYDRPSRPVVVSDSGFRILARSVWLLLMWDWCKCDSRSERPTKMEIYDEEWAKINADEEALGAMSAENV
jgi:hypothetical protein